MSETVRLIGHTAMYSRKSRGEIGDAYITRVSVNPEWWHVLAEMAGGPDEHLYDGPSREEAETAYQQARSMVWAS